MGKYFIINCSSSWSLITNHTTDLKLLNCRGTAKHLAAKNWQWFIHNTALLSLWSYLGRSKRLEICASWHRCIYMLSLVLWSSAAVQVKLFVNIYRKWITQDDYRVLIQSYFFARLVKYFKFCFRNTSASVDNFENWC